jgi:hypothetical protein
MELVLDLEKARNIGKIQSPVNLKKLEDKKMFYTDEEHNYTIYEKNECLTFEKDVYPVAKRIQEELRQNYPKELRDEWIQDFMNLTESDWMGNERYIAECMINIENHLNDRGMSLDDPNLIEDSVKEFVKMEWYVDFSKM